jgi:hypothetical protein
VTLDIFDVQGRLVKSLADRKPYAPGRHTIRVERGLLPSGLYFVRFQTAQFEQSRRLIVIE